jgi:hypothetical protein
LPWNGPEPLDRTTPSLSATRSTTCAAAGVRGVGIVSMLATEDDLLAAGAVESASSVVEWAERFLAELTKGA